MDSLENLDDSATQNKAMRYLHILEIDNVEKLRNQDPQELYEKLCRKTETPQDPSIIQTFAKAIAQAQQSDGPLDMTLS